MTVYVEIHQLTFVGILQRSIIMQTVEIMTNFYSDGQHKCTAWLTVILMNVAVPNGNICTFSGLNSKMLIIL